MTTEEKGYKQSEEEGAVFNMALDTLKRLGIILSQINLISSDIFLTDEIKQAWAAKID